MRLSLPRILLLALAAVLPCEAQTIATTLTDPNASFHSGSQSTKQRARFMSRTVPATTSLLSMAHPTRSQPSLTLAHLILLLLQLTQ
jgi:hypothetical protein